WHAQNPSLYLRVLRVWASSDGAFLKALAHELGNPKPPLKDIDVEALRRHLNVTGLASAGREVWDRVIENSKQYFSADEQTRKAMDDIIRGQSEGD
ncbi:MAG: hypothetical protein JRI22_23670, partial [Deltaproteobacteria bacterium]|nr:hypothetical protein [Deltaproteobacteria bacterium]